MARVRSNLEKAAGQLIAAIQREWAAELGSETAKVSEQVMHASHELLQAAKLQKSIANVVGHESVARFLGVEWVESHPAVLPYVLAIEAAEKAENP